MMRGIAKWHVFMSNDASCHLPPAPNPPCMCLPLVVPLFHLMLAMGWCIIYKKVWCKKTEAFTWHFKALQGTPIKWISPWETNLPLNFATRYLADNKTQLASSATLKHYVKIGCVKKLPLKTPSMASSQFVRKFYFS